MVNNVPICLSCDVFKNITMTYSNPTEGNVCVDPNENEKSIIGKYSYVTTATDQAFRWYLTSTDAIWLPVPTVYIAAERLTSVDGTNISPVIGQFTDEGGDIFCQVTATWTGREGFESGSKRPWINGTVKTISILRIFVFNYAGCVPESYSSQRNPDHAFGVGTINPSSCVSYNGATCNSQAVIDNSGAETCTNGICEC